MAIRCPDCGLEYDVALFSFGKALICDCGRIVSALVPHLSLAPGKRGGRPRRGMKEIARGADRIATMILDGDCPEIDVEIAIRRLRERAEELFPGRGRLFRILYEARFRRLREQWTKPGQRRLGW